MCCVIIIFKIMDTHTISSCKDTANGCKSQELHLTAAAPHYFMSLFCLSPKGVKSTILEGHSYINNGSCRLPLRNSLSHTVRPELV